MVKRIMSMIIIALLLVGLAFTESILVGNFMTEIQDSVDGLVAIYEASQDDITGLRDTASSLENKWDSKENSLGLMFNYKDLSYISDSFTRLTEYTEQNDYDDAIVEIHLLQEYLKRNYTNMSFNFNNIF